MDKTDQIIKQHKEANDFLVRDSNFERTSVHPSWQGKVKCRYCKARGWPGSVQINPLWWGKNHGYECKWKELWLMKNRSYQNTINYTYGSNANIPVFQWQSHNTSTYFRMTGF